VADEAQIIGEARDYDELVAVIRRRKDALQLSDAVVDELGGLAVGHTSKLLGSVPVKTLARVSLPALLGALAIKIVIMVDDEQAARIRRRWQRKATVMDHPPVMTLRQARPIIRERDARKAAMARWKGKTPEERAAVVASLNAARAAKKVHRARTKEAA
jgi:hypothetical protein